jgi:hypothetical protein
MYNIKKHSEVNSRDNGGISKQVWNRGSLPRLLVRDAVVERFLMSQIRTG